MPTRKIVDEVRPCSHREHDPPSMMVFENGLWEHICPACGHRQVFRVSKPTFATVENRWTAAECQVEHPNWDGPMICGNPMPCRRHGG